MAITIQVERFNDVIEEVQPLLDRNWEEIANYRDFVPLAPNYARFAVLATAEKIIVVTARENGALVGYASFILDTQLHYATVLLAENGIIWVAPEKRGKRVGLRLIQAAEREVVSRGACIMRFREKINHPLLGKILTIMGYTKTEIIHEKILQRPE